MIEVKNLVKRYGNHLAVDHLNFTVETGQVYGFLGPNGAGKSTTMNIMTGYLGATEGKVIINGHDILKEPEAAKKCIGYLPEIPPLYTEMTVLEYLDFVAELKKIPQKERKEQIQQVMDLVRVTDMQYRLIRNLSKGYKQRVGLAQAIMGFPEIIILDEPTVGLDPKQIIEIRELIRELAKNHTVILSSHILGEIQEVCDYIMIISHGRLVASDTPENLEKRMSGQQAVEFVARGSKEQAEYIVEHMAEVQEYTLSDGEEEGTVRGSIIPQAGKDIREAVFCAFAESGCPLLMLNHSRTTLEDVFLELTQKSQDIRPEAEEEPETLEETEEEEQSGEEEEHAGDL